MNKRFTILYFAVALTAGTIVACSGEEAEKPDAIADVVAEPGEDTTKRELGYFEHSEKNPFNDKLFKAWKLAKKKAKFIEFFCNTYDGTFFLSQNIESMYNDGKFLKNVRFGLIDGSGNVLLPKEYDQIGNPGMIATDYMEIKKGGKYGLYNYVAGKTIEPEYDALYPSRIMEYVAIGQKGSQFFKIYADGKSKAFKEGQPAPNYARLMHDYRYSSESEFYAGWISTQALNEYDGEDFYAYGGYVTFIPSYMARLRIFEEPLSWIQPKWSEFGEDSLDLAVVDAKMRNDDIYSMLTSLYSYSAEARGYDVEIRHLVTFDKKNTIRSSKKVMQYSNGDLYNFVASNFSKPSMRFLNDSVVEVRSYMTSSETIYSYDQEGVSAEEAPYAENAKRVPYDNYTKYEYYMIAADGTVKALTDGFFPMASAIPMTKEHFKGCFARIIYGEELFSSELYDEEAGNRPIFAFTDHLSAADLEYMRNEIYARHGMKFKDQTWADEFKKYKWYKASRSSVTSLLTPIEKKNLQLIQQLEKDLKKSQDKLVHVTYDFAFMGA